MNNLIINGLEEIQLCNEKTKCFSEFILDYFNLIKNSNDKDINSLKIIKSELNRYELLINLITEEAYSIDDKCDEIIFKLMKNN